MTTGSEANTAKVFPGSELPACSLAAPYEEQIIEKLESGLTAQRIWKDLVEEWSDPAYAQLRIAGITPVPG